jgi:excisionase family DNA binding protein
MSDLKIFLSEAEAMEALAIGRTLLRRMVAERRLVPVHIGRRLLFHIDEVRRFAEELKQKAAEQRDL